MLDLLILVIFIGWIMCMVIFPMVYKSGEDEKGSKQDKEIYKNK